MVKDLDVIKFDSVAWNVLPGVLELQQSGRSESAINQELNSTHAYLNSIGIESSFAKLLNIETLSSGFVLSRV